MKITWDHRDEDIQILFMCIDEEKKHEVLTLYWGKKWGAGDGFTVSGGIGGTYYSHHPIEAESVPEAMEKTEQWFANRINECLENCMKSANFYRELLNVLPDPKEVE